MGPGRQGGLGLKTMDVIAARLQQQQGWWPLAGCWHENTFIAAAALSLDLPAVADIKSEEP